MPQTITLVACNGEWGLRNLLRNRYTGPEAKKSFFWHTNGMEKKVETGRSRARG